MFIEAKLLREIQKSNSEYIFIDDNGNQYTVKYLYIFGEPYHSCNAILKKIRSLGEYAALIK